MQVSIRHIFSLSLLSLLAIVVSAQYVGPSSRVLQFRIYGKDARPIDNSSQGYKIKVEGENNKNIQLNNTGSGVGVEEFPYSNNPVKIKIAHGNEIMTLTSSSDLDSVSFTPGNFYIPWDYAPLFKIKCSKDTKIINQNLSFFKTTSPDSAPKLNRLNFTCQNNFSGTIKQIHSDNIKTMIVLVEGKPRTYFLLKSTDKGSTWKKIPITGLLPSQPLNELSVIESQNYLLGLDQKKSKYFVIRVNEDGKALFDSILTKMQTYSLKFIDSKTGFALGLAPDGLSSFYRTTDGGSHWELMYSKMKINNASIFHFADANIGFIRIFNYLQEDKFFKTEDGGLSWKKCTASPKLFSPALPAIFHHDFTYPYQMEYFSISDENEIFKLSIGFEQVPVSCITFFDKNRGVIVSDNYILYTKDGCKTWNYIPPNFGKASALYESNLKVLNAEFLDKNTLLLFTDNGICTTKLQE